MLCDPHNAQPLLAGALKKPLQEACSFRIGKEREQFVNNEQAWSLCLAAQLPDMAGKQQIPQRAQFPGERTDIKDDHRPLKGDVGLAAKEAGETAMHKAVQPGTQSRRVRPTATA